MATVTANGVRIAYELTGSGEVPIVFVHGSWGSHHAFDQVALALSERFRVMTYDRRGHSDSERPPGQGSVHEDVADLAALIEDLGLAPAWVAGTSYGARSAPPGFTSCCEKRTVMLDCRRPELRQALRGRHLNLGAEVGL